MRKFLIATPDEILAGKTTDVYFERTIHILEAKNIHKRVKAEFTAKRLPKGYDWAIFAGLSEVLHLLEGKPLTVRALPEGSVFYSDEPVLEIEGDYLDFSVYETPILGLICHASGIATKSARCRKAANDKLLVSFGARRIHPALAPMLAYYAYMGGTDGVATIAGAATLDITPTGTMPHALILILGDVVEATKSFDETIPPDVPRIALIDTLSDERDETLRVVTALKDKLTGVRFDTPFSRRGNFAKLIDEVRWELHVRGFDNIKIFASGGIDEYSILELTPYVDGFGVGTSISNAKVIDFAMDIVEIDGQPIAKRGKKSGSKSIYECTHCGRRVVELYTKRPYCDCGTPMKDLLQVYMKDGKLVTQLPSIHDIRKKVIFELKRLPNIKESN